MMSRALCVENALYQGRRVDLHVSGKRVSGLYARGQEKKPDNAESFDASGLHLFPSFIDAHTHLREPGFEWKETVASGLAAAVHGGFGAVMCMANTSPVNDEPAITLHILEQAAKAYPQFKAGEGPRVYPVGAATRGLKGEELTRMGELVEAGCVAFSNDGLPVTSSEMMRRAMEYAAGFGCFIIDHCEDPHLGYRAHMNEGLTSSLLGLKGQPDVGETIHVARAVLLAEYLDLPVHIAHVSSARSADMISWAKSRGVKVTAETCPHYLFLDDTALQGYNTNAKVNPPLRSPKDCAALIAALKNGVIDMLVTDHAPHAGHEKETTLDEAPAGLTGLDLAVALTWKLVAGKFVDEALFTRLWCDNPARIFKTPHNDFSNGARADFFLFDPEKEWTVTAQTLHSKSANTPWLNQTLKGKVVAHWIGGQRLV
jgi:dihydroorotase